MLGQVQQLERAVAFFKIEVADMAQAFAAPRAAAGGKSGAAPAGQSVRRVAANGDPDTTHFVRF